MNSIKKLALTLGAASLFFVAGIATSNNQVGEGNCCSAPCCASSCQCGDGGACTCNDCGCSNCGGSACCGA